MGVEFNENKIDSYSTPSTDAGAITNMIIRMGMAKNEKSAQKVMIVIAVIFFILAAYIFFK